MRIFFRFLLVFKPFWIFLTAVRVRIMRLKNMMAHGRGKWFVLISFHFRNSGNIVQHQSYGNSMVLVYFRKGWKRSCWLWSGITCHYSLPFVHLEIQEIQWDSWGEKVWAKVHVLCGFLWRKVKAHMQATKFLCSRFLLNLMKTITYVFKMIILLIILVLLLWKYDCIVPVFYSILVLRVPSWQKMLLVNVWKKIRNYFSCIARCRKCIIY